MARQWQPWIDFRARHPTTADGMARLGSAVRPYLPPVNFITMHHAYFVFLGLVFALIFWGASHPGQSVSFTDSLFLVESAFTGSGLNTVNISQLTTGQQVILAVMMILGSPVLIGLFTIWFRAHIFEERFEDIVEMERSRKRTTGAIVGMAGAMFGTPVLSSFRRAPGPRRSHKQGGGLGGLARRGTWMHTKRAEADAFQLAGPRDRDPEAAAQQTQTQTQTQTQAGQQLDTITEGQRLGAGLEPVTSTARPISVYTQASQATKRRPYSSREDERPDGGFDFGTFIRKNKKNIGRNGQFFDLTDEERDRLGGVEYRSLRILLVIVSVYFVLLQVLGSLALGAWISVHGSSIAAVNSQNPWWAGVFLCISSFNNAGMTLLDAGIAAFEGDAFVLTVVTLLALSGCYAFPAFIRATVYVLSVLLERFSDEHEHAAWKEAFDFILKYPRRLFMMMFPAKANWTFVAICTALGAVNWVMLLVLSVGNSVLGVYPVGKRIGLALFQSLTIPSGGYTVISASSLYFDVQVLWVLMMYVAAYPEIIVMRNSNVYEERSLGIYTSEDEKSNSDSDSSGKTSLDELLSNHGPYLSAESLGGTTGQPPLTSMSAGAASLAASRVSARSIKKLATVGRRGTAFVGKVIKQSVNNFQGVGVTPAPRLLRRAQEMDFGSQDPTATTATIRAPVVVAEEGHVSLVTQHLRSQLSHDMWSIALALFLITLIETSHSVEDPRTYSVFNYLFEIVSGYTNIGLSIGLPGQSFSFSGGWYVGSKLIMVLMMIRGRHRGLPVALDHAVKMPGWDNVKRQQEDAEIRRSIGRSRASMDDPDGEKV